MGGTEAEILMPQNAGNSKKNPFLGHQYLCFCTPYGLEIFFVSIFMSAIQ